MTNLVSDALQDCGRVANSVFGPAAPLRHRVPSRQYCLRGARRPEKAVHSHIRMRIRRAHGLIALLLLVTIASAVYAQYYRVPEGYGVPVRTPPLNFEDGGFTACKLMYTSNRREAGGIGWPTDYPYAAINLMRRLSELTKTRVSRDAQHEVNYWVVRLTDPMLFDCPVVLGTDVGTASFSDEEAKRLREYLLKGGFLWVDDF